MADHYLPIFLSLVLAISTLHVVLAVEYNVTNLAPNSPGGVRFNNELGAEYTKQSMRAATAFIWRLFKQSKPADRKTVQFVPLFVEEMEGVAYASNDEIHFSAGYIQGIQGDIKKDFNGVLYHEMTHIWQWDGSAGTKAPSGLVEGIADFVRLKGVGAPGWWVQPGAGNRWDQGYDVTARFLDYCNDLRDGFVAELNKKMRRTYSDNFFVELLGQTVDELWSDYKDEFAN